MGGRGSGRQATKRTGTIESCVSLDAAMLKEHIAVVWAGTYTGSGQSGPGVVDFRVEREGERGLVVQLYGPVNWYSFARPVAATFSLESTVPYFGGRRWWFRCPGCDRRARKLYWSTGRILFGCHVCLSLGYESQQGDRKHRLRLKVSRLKHRLGAIGYDAAPAAPIPLKPKGMRWKTYQRRVDKLWVAQWALCGEMEDWLAQQESKRAAVLQKLRQLES